MCIDITDIFTDGTGQEIQFQLTKIEITECVPSVNSIHFRTDSYEISSERSEAISASHSTSACPPR